MLGDGVDASSIAVEGAIPLFDSMMLRALLPSYGVDGLVKVLGALQLQNDPSKLCGKRDVPVTQESVVAWLEGTLGIVALAMREPRTLTQSMRSWRKGGLLQRTNERVVILSDPIPADIQVGLDYDFEVVEPNTMVREKGYDAKKLIEPNVITIGAAWAHALEMMRSDYVFFMEKDFNLDVSLGLDRIKEEILVSICPQCI